YSEQQEEQIEGPAKEVLRYREALWKGHEYLKGRSDFDIDYFVNVCRTLRKTNESIRPPFSQTFISQGGSGPNAGKPIYTLPRGEKINEAKLENMVNFMTDDELCPLDTLLKMAIGHFKFEAIHPFRDGNGRTGR